MMNRNRVILLAAMVLLAACSHGVPALPRLARDAVIVAYGDSLTYGTGARPEESYPAVLASLTGRRVVNAGSPGEESDEGLARLPGVLDESRPDLVVLCHGGNDLLRHRSADETASNLRAMVREARSRGIPVILIGVPEPGLLLSSADLYERLADDLEIPYDGDILPEILAKGSLKSDLVHPNRDGYRRLAEAVRSLLAASGAVEPG